MSATFVIVGGGLAGAKLAEALREQGFDGSVVLLAAENRLPYERPPLSKGYLTGADEIDGAVVHPRDWYDEHRIDLRLSAEVTSIDPAAHRVTLASGETIGYDKLALATGSEPRVPDLPGAAAALYLRTVADSDTLKSVFGSARHLVVVGAGWIGLEVAAAARGAGVAVTVLESAAQPLLRVLGPEMAGLFERLHRDHGVEFRFQVSVRDVLVRDGRAVGVTLADGETVEADAVLVAVGAGPRVALAAAAGLTVDNGVRVDSALRTSDADIVAVGDIAHADHPFYGHPVRVEHWANALNQPAVAARTLRGETAEFDELPYFFTDQYDLGMEYVGFVGPDGYDRFVARGDVDGREFIGFWLAGGRVQAAMAVNTWDMVEPLTALILSRAAVDPAKLADPDVALEPEALA